LDFKILRFGSWDENLFITIEEKVFDHYPGCMLQHLVLEKDYFYKALGLS